MDESTKETGIIALTIVLIVAIIVGGMAYGGKKSSESYIEVTKTAMSYGYIQVQQQGSGGSPIWVKK